MSKYIGDFPEDSVVSFEFNVFDANDEPAAFSGAGSLTESVEVYKSGSTTPHTAKYTPAVLDSNAGVYRLEIDMSAHAFFEAGKNYSAILTGADIEAGSGKSVTNTIIRSWSCEARSALLPDGHLDAGKFATDVLATDEELATTFWAALTAANTTSGSFGELVGGLVNAVVKKFGVPLTVTGTPTTTSIDVTSAESLTNTQIDNALMLHLDTGRYTRITNITGTTITVSPALPSAPVAGREIVVFGQYLASL